MPLIEKRYAEALLSLAASEDLVETYQKDLQSVVDMMGQLPEFKSYLLDPKIKTESKKKMMSGILNGKTKTKLANFCMLLLDKGRISYLKGILKEYTHLADSWGNVLNITVISSVPLEQDQLTEIGDKFKKLYNSSLVKISQDIDTKVIGGIKVKIGDKEIDGTIKGRIDGLKELLLSN